MKSKTYLYLYVDYPDQIKPDKSHAIFKFLKLEVQIRGHSQTTYTPKGYGGWANIYFTLYPLLNKIVYEEGRCWKVQKTV